MYQLFDHLGYLVDSFKYQQDAIDAADELCYERPMFRQFWYVRHVF